MGGWVAPRDDPGPIAPSGPDRAPIAPSGLGRPIGPRLCRRAPIGANCTKLASPSFAIDTVRR